jgi:hypothetical protein
MVRQSLSPVLIWVKCLDMLHGPVWKRSRMHDTIIDKFLNPPIQCVGTIWNSIPIYDIETRGVSVIAK